MVIVQVAVDTVLLALIVVVPGDFAVTTPLLLTVATTVLELVHEAVFEPVMLIAYWQPTYVVALVVWSFMVPAPLVTLIRQVEAPFELYALMVT